LENNSRKPRDLIVKLALWQPEKVQLTLSQGKKKNEDEAADGEDGNVLRTSVLQPSDSNTVELLLSTQYT
jgi:hypothetical protein